MQLDRLIVKGFQSFGPEPTTVTFDSRTFLIGPNGAGKTAALQALTRLFGYPSQARSVRPSDFHQPAGPLGAEDAAASNELWIEAHFTLPELTEDGGLFPAVPACFEHMTLPVADGIPELRVRLTATIDEDLQVDESLVYVGELDEDGEPAKTSAMNRFDRGMIQVHYLPAKRDPADHIRYTTTSLLGRLLRSASWADERASIETLTGQLGDVLAGHAAIEGITTHVAGRWSAVHQGAFFANPSVTFDASDVDALLRHMTIRFGPAPGAAQADFNLLSDGQQSLLYISLVLAVQAIGRKVLTGDAPEFDADKLRPPVFVMIAVEEPENSLSPHHLGRLLSELTEFSATNDAQVAFATHSPALLRRVPPEQIRFLRLDGQRRTSVQMIEMPDAVDEASKYVREAVLAYPELYFARLVVLGEGASEEVVLPRILAARGLVPDHMSVSVVPLGGRHVNHFWRLLHGLGIPHVTLIDLDAGRHQAGWSRLRYALKQYQAFAPDAAIPPEHFAAVQSWDSVERPDRHDDGKLVIDWLETHGVFFSAPLDLDFSMIDAYPVAYGDASAERGHPDEPTVVAVLGKNHAPTTQYSEEELELFEPYRATFISGSKPAAHLEALAQLSDDQLLERLPPTYNRLIQSLSARLEALPE
jgi:putative ATP-dependent endonuclease of OLD family